MLVDQKRLYKSFMINIRHCTTAYPGALPTTNDEQRLLHETYLVKLSSANTSTWDLATPDLIKCCILKLKTG